MEKMIKKEVMDKVMKAIEEVKNALFDNSYSKDDYCMLIGYIFCLKDSGIKNLEHIENEEKLELICEKLDLECSFYITNSVLRKQIMHLTKRMIQDFNEAELESVNNFLDLPIWHYDFLGIYDEFLKKEGFGYQQGFITNEIVELAYRLTKSPNALYVPFAGVGSSFYENEDLTPFYGKYFACESNDVLANIGQIRAFLFGYEEKVSYCPFVDIITETGFDGILSMPPFFKKIESLIDEKKEISSELLPFDVFFDSHNYIEKNLVSLVPMSFLTKKGGEEEQIRKYATDHGLIDKIVELPDGLLYGVTIPVAAISMSKQKKGNRCTIIDARDAYSIKEDGTKILDLEACRHLLYEEDEKKIIISFEEIIANDYSWFYTKEIYEQARINFSAIDKSKRLGEILEKVEEDEISDSLFGHAFEIDEERSYADSLRNNDWLLEAHHANEYPIKYCNHYNYKIIRENVFIFSKKAQFLVYCKATSDTPILISQDMEVQCYRLNKQLNSLVDADYLLSEIKRNNVQLESLSGGHLFLILNGLPGKEEDYSDFENIKVYIPTIEEQKARFQDFRLSEAREQGLLDVIEAMKAEYINEVRMRKHDMRPYLKQIRSASKLIEHYVNQEEQTENGEIILQKVNSILMAVSKLSESLDHFSDEEEFGLPEKIDVNKYLQNLVNEKNRDGKYSFMIKRDVLSLIDCGLIENAEVAATSPLNINVAEYDLGRLVQNILENAITHGFTDSNRSDYCVSITIGADSTRNLLCIDFLNNGKPFPAGLTKEKYGLLGEKAGETAGTGRGGHIVKKILNHYRGDYELIVSNGVCGIRIYLPYII